VRSWYPEPNTIRDYDVDGWNKVWAHTFTSLQPPHGYLLCGGTLEMRVKNSDDNDALGLPFVDATGTAKSDFFSRRLSALGFPSTQAMTLTFDLAALPGLSGAVNVLPDIASRGYLDTYVQDDSAVDYTSLQLKYCPDPNGPPQPVCGTNPGTE
jgi:hypothetical protein